MADKNDTEQRGPFRAPGFGPWLLALPFALVVAFGLPWLAGWHPLWGVPIYIVAGVTLGLFFARIARATPQSK